jgi:hypothetical protein
MVTYSKLLLSASTNGRAIPVSLTGTTGNLIHAAIADVNNLDEVYLYGINNYGSNINGTVWFGGTNPSDAIITSIPPNGSGRVQIVDGRLLNNNLPITVTTTQAGTNGIFIEGFVNRITGLGSTLDPRVTDWATRVVRNGGATPSLSTQYALSTFMQSLNATGLRTKMLALNAFVPDNLIAAITPLIYDVGLNPWTNTAFVSSDLTINGLKGNASTKYLNIGYLASSLTSTSVGATFYVYSQTGLSGGADYGCDQGSVYFLGTANISNSVAMRSGALANVIAPATPGSGYYCDTRISATDHRGFFANSKISHAQIGSTDTTSFSSSLPGEPIYVFAINAGGGLQIPTNDTISFFAIHTGLTASDSANLFAAVQTLRQSLGGGFL